MGPNSFTWVSSAASPVLSHVRLDGELQTTALDIEDCRVVAIM
jgi:hypothetical protein